MTRVPSRLCAVVATGLWLAGPASAESMFGATANSNRVGIGTPLEQAFGDCGNPCVVHENTGGKLYTFFLASQELQAKRIKLVIDGPCYSACASIADRIRADVCITPRAVFGFHLRHETMIVDDEPITVNPGRGRAAEQPLSNEVRAWVLRHGGFPSSATSYTFMRFKDATQFWHRCEY